MNPFGLPDSERFDIFEFRGNAVSQGVEWVPWRRPKNRSMAHIFMLGSGGGGGNGVIGANSTAAGGGGGGSAAQISLLVPLILLPPVLYVSVPLGSTGAGFKSYLSIEPANTTANAILAYAEGGGVGGNASGGSAGTGGIAGIISANTSMPFGWPFVQSNLGGQVGLAGGTNVGSSAFSIATTGLRTMGATGGAGLPAAGIAGNDSGKSASNLGLNFPIQPGALGALTATAPPQNGSNGFEVISAGKFFYSGSGGASTHGSATGAGLIQASGGDGAYGAGGGGMGGALTGSAAGIKSRGGNGLVIITCF